MRALNALLLSLLLAVTSVTTAVARGQEPMGLTLTLCSEGVAQTVTLDANGNPVAPHEHHCPDCLSGLLALDLPAPLPPLARPLTRAAALALPQPIQAASAPRTPSRARGPPVFSA
jgi:hypothetical protein